MRLSLALLFCGAICCAGCGTDEETETETTGVETPGLPDSATSGETIMTAVNAHCPIMGGEVTDDGGRTDWKGKTIGFCCPGCIDEWNELSEDDKEAKLTKHNSEEAGEHHHGEGEASGA